MDTAVFFALQQLTGRSKFFDGLWVFLATYLIWLELGAILVYFFLDRRRYLLIVSAGLSALSGWLLARGIGEVWYRPRPFAAFFGVHQLIGMSNLEKSFPSEHATIAFAMAGAVWLFDRRWGMALFGVASLIAIGRILVGVHYPSDVLVGAALGVGMALVFHRLIHGFLHTKHHQAK